MPDYSKPDRTEAKVRLRQWGDDNRGGGPQNNLSPWRECFYENTKVRKSPNRLPARCSVSRGSLTVKGAEWSGDVEEVDKAIQDIRHKHKNGERLRRVAYAEYVYSNRDDGWEAKTREAKLAKDSYYRALGELQDWITVELNLMANFIDLRK